MRKVTLIVIALVAVFAVTETVPLLVSNFAPLTGGPVHGVVVDANTNLPLQGATVIVHWVGHLSGSHGPSYPCYHVALAQSNEKGIFNVPKWNMSREDGHSWTRGMTTSDMEKPIKVLAYKPGYVLEQGRVGFSVDEEVLLRMAPFVGSVMSRLSDLVSPFSYHVMCDADDKSLLPLYKAMYDEAAATAKTSEELKLADHLLIALETAQYGNNEALSRAGAREINHIKVIKK